MFPQRQEDAIVVKQDRQRNKDKNSDEIGPTNKLNRFMTSQLEKNRKANKSEQPIDVDIDYESMADQ